MSKYYDPTTFQLIDEIKIERDDIEQALSWYRRIPFQQITRNDENAFQRLLSVTHRMRAL